MSLLWHALMKSIVGMHANIFGIFDCMVWLSRLINNQLWEVNFPFCHLKLGMYSFLKIVIQKIWFITKASFAVNFANCLKTGCYSSFDIIATITKSLDQSINLFWKRNCIVVIGRGLLLTHQLQKFLNREFTNINGLDLRNKSKANER